MTETKCRTTNRARRIQILPKGLYVKNVMLLSLFLPLQYDNVAIENA